MIEAEFVDDDTSEDDDIWVPTPTVPLVSFEALVHREIGWLWPGRLALGKVGLLIGDPDCGKSLLALAIAAHVSTGRPWPDGGACRPGRVLLLAGEDDAADTIGPRLFAAGADLSNVAIFDPERATANPLTLPDDIGRLERLILCGKLLDGSTPLRLIVFDPLAAFITGMAGEAKMRRVLGPLGELARRCDCAILAIVHLNKKGAGKALYRATGSIALVAAARHVYAVGRDPADPARRLIAPVKNNLAAAQTGLAFTIVAGEKGQPRLEWLPPPGSLRAEDLLRAAPETSEASGALDEARQWLLGLIEKGPVRACEVRNRARADGLAWRTVLRAKAHLGIGSSRPADGSNLWLWSKP